MVIRSQVVEWGTPFKVKSSTRVSSDYDFKNQFFRAQAAFLCQLTEEEINNPELIKNMMMYAFSQETPEAVVSNYRIEVIPLAALDLNGDMVIDQKDVDYITQFFGYRKGEPEYVEAFDFNKDGIIDIIDISIVSWFVDHPITHGFSYICNVTLKIEGYGKGLFVSPWILALLVLAGTLVIGIAMFYGYNVWLDVLEIYKGPDAPDPPVPPEPMQYDLDGDGIVSPAEYELYLKAYNDYLAEYKGYQQEFPPPPWVPVVIIVAGGLGAVYIGGKLIDWLGRRRRE